MYQTIRNHFLPQAYLNRFISSNQRVCCGNIENNTVFASNTNNIGCKNNLYSINNKLTYNDIDNACILFNITKNLQFLQILVSFLNDELADLISIEINNNLQAEKSANEFLQQINSPGTSRSQEILFTFYEGQCQNIFNQIVETNDISVLNETHEEESVLCYLWLKISDFIYKQLHSKLKYEIKELSQDEKKQLKCQNEFKPDNMYDLVHYLLIQYFRTEKSIEGIKTTLNIHNVNPDVSFLCIHCIPIEMTKRLLGDGYKIILIKNTSSIDFITCDQPCLNLYSSIITNRPLEDNELELYFPLTPKLALLCTNKQCYASKSIITSNDDSSNQYNKAIKFNSSRFIYGNTEILLRKYLF